jgi:hypothetical protein
MINKTIVAPDHKIVGSKNMAGDDERSILHHTIILLLFLLLLLFMKLYILWLVCSENLGREIWHEPLEVCVDVVGINIEDHIGLLLPLAKLLEIRVYLGIHL